MNIFYFYFIVNPVCVVSALWKNQQNRLKFACDGQSEIESEVCVIASCQKIISVTLCATKVNAADFKRIFMRRLIFTTIKEGKIRCMLLKAKFM